MAILLRSKTVRLPVNAGTGESFTDQLTRAPVKFPIADLRLECAFFYGAINSEALQLVDLSNWVSVTATIKAMGVNNTAPLPSSANLAQKVVAAADLVTDMTSEQWSALTGYQAAFDFAEAEINNITAPGKVWLVLTALLDSGIVIPLAFGPIEAVQDGYASAGTTPAEQDTSYTKAEALALFGNATYNTITARTGGGATALDGLATAGGAAATGTTVRTRSGAGGGREEWALEAGTDAEDADAGIVRPDDYDGTTNARVWRQIL